MYVVFSGRSFIS